MDRRRFIASSSILAASPLLAKIPDFPAESAHGRILNNSKDEFPLMDLHVHRSKDLTIDDIVSKSKAFGMKIGVMENIAPWGITNDAQLEEYIDAMRPYPVYIGLQPMSPGWSKGLSPSLIAQADYIAMDPQIVPDGNKYGETILLWEYSAYIDDPEEFMFKNMAHYMSILTGDEPLDILACPLFLPICIEREYGRLWTRKRLEQIIEAAVAKGVAIEINDTVRVPHPEFILMAKRAGLKFTFGSDARNQSVGRLDYCKQVARECRLTEKDFFMPKREL